MEKSQLDTEWQVSKKGNLWRRLDGSILVIVENWGGLLGNKGRELSKPKFQMSDRSRKSCRGQVTR